MLFVIKASAYPQHPRLDAEGLETERTIEVAGGEILGIDGQMKLNDASRLGLGDYGCEEFSGGSLPR
ncbi:hypothetical protein QNM99_20860 [Pseudomonas sp. PCH446]